MFSRVLLSLELSPCDESALSLRRSSIALLPPFAELLLTPSLPTAAPVMASRAFAAVAAALSFVVVAGFPAPPPLRSPAQVDLSLTPFNISMDCVNSAVLPSLAGLQCVVSASVFCSSSFDVTALVSLTIDGYFYNGTRYRFADSSTLASFSGRLNPASPVAGAYGSWTTVNWTVALPPSFETSQLLATVVVDWPNELQETNEGNNIARRMLQNNGLPYIVLVEQEYLGTFVFGVDMLQRIIVTLDKPLPSNAYIALMVDQDKFTNIDSRTNVLSAVTRSGKASFYEYTLTFGMGTVRPLGRDSATAEVPFEVQLVFGPLPGASPQARFNLTGNSQFAASMSPGYIAQSVYGSFTFTNYRGIVNDLIGLIYPISDSANNAGQPLRATQVTNNLVFKNVDPSQRSAYFYIEGTIPASSFIELGTQIANPAVASTTWGNPPTGVLSGAYGAALVMGDIHWAYGSASSGLWIETAKTASNISLMAGGVSFDLPLKFTILFDDGNARASDDSVTSTSTQPDDQVASASSISESFQAPYHDQNVIGFRMEVDGHPLFAVNGASRINVNLADGKAAALTLQWNVPGNKYWTGQTSFDIMYVPSLAALRFIGNENYQGVQSHLVEIPPDASPFLKSGSLFFIRKRTLTVMINGPQLAYSDDAGRLQRLSSSTYWDALNVGGHVNFTLDVGEGANTLLSRIDYILRWKPYNVTTHGFAIPLTRSIQSTYLGYALARAANYVNVSSLPSAAVVPWVLPIEGTKAGSALFYEHDHLKWMQSSFDATDDDGAQVHYVRSDARLSLAANLDFTNMAAVYESGGPGTSQKYPDVNLARFDCADCSLRSLRALAQDWHAARRELASSRRALVGTTNIDSIRDFSDDTWNNHALASFESYWDYYYEDDVTVVPHFWPSMAYATPDLMLVAVEARPGWLFQYALDNSTALSKTANFSVIRIFAESQSGDANLADWLWTIPNPDRSFNGYPAIGAYYGKNYTDVDEPFVVGNRSVVVWLRDLDGNTDTGSHWGDQTIMWSRLQLSGAADTSADDPYTATWSAPRAVTTSGSPNPKTIEALQVAVDATCALITRVDPDTRKAHLHAWRISGAGTYATTVVSDDSPVGQVTLLRDADGGTGFTVAYVHEGNVKYVRGTITDGAGSAPVLSKGSPVSIMSSEMAATVGGASILAGCLTPYGQAISFLTRAGLVVSEAIYGSSIGFEGAVALVNNGPFGNVDRNSDDNIPANPPVASGYISSVNDLQVARQKGLQVAYADPRAYDLAGGESGPNAGVFHPTYGPKVVAVVQTEDFSSDLKRHFAVYSAYSSVEIVNVTFPGADTPGSTFLVRTELTNNGAVRSTQMVLTVSHIVSEANDAVLGVTIVPPILAGRTVYIETLASVPVKSGFFVHVEIKASPSSTHSSAWGYDDWFGSPNSVSFANANLDSSLGLVYQIVNSGPLFGQVTVCGYRRNTACSASQASLVDSWSTTDVVVPSDVLANFFETGDKLTVQPIAIRALSGKPANPFTGTVPWTNARFGEKLNTLLVAADSNHWDNAVFLAVGALRAVLTPDSIVAYPAYRPGGVTDFVNALGITNAGNVPWPVSFIPGVNTPFPGWQPSFFEEQRYSLDCDGIGCKDYTNSANGYWCTGSRVDRGPQVVLPGETCYVYGVDKGAALSQTSYAQFSAFTLNNRLVLGGESDPIAFPSLLIAPHVQPSVASSEYETWDEGTPGNSVYYGGHYAMWRPYADNIGEPLLVLAMGSTVTFEGDVTNFTAFIATESANCENICSTRTGGQSCDAYSEECFDAPDGVTANLVLSLWRPVPPANVSTIHYGDYYNVKSYTFEFTRAGHTTTIPAGSDFDWHVLPGDIFGWYSDYDNAARVVFSNDTAVTQGPGGPATAAGYYKYSRLPQGRERTVPGPDDTPVSINFLSDSDLATFPVPRQYSIEVGVQPASKYTGRINLAVDLARDIVLVSTQASAGTCPSVTCPLPYLCDRRRERALSFPFTDDGATLDPSAEPPLGCHYGESTSTSNVLTDPFAVVVGAWKDNVYQPITTIGYGAPVYGNECQTVVLPLTDELRTWILNVDQSNFCSPPVTDVEALTPLSDEHYKLVAGILPVTELYKATSLDQRWIDHTYAGAHWEFTVSQVLGQVGQKWGLSQCPQQSSASALFGRDTSTPTLHVSKADGIVMTATVQTTCSRTDVNVNAPTSCNEQPVPALSPTSATVAYSIDRHDMRVTLDSTGTYDPSGDTLLFSWHVVSKPVFSKISDEDAFAPALQTVQPNNCDKQSFNASKVWFSPDVGGVYIVEFHASDGCTVSAARTTITVTCGVAPTALISHVQAVFNHAQTEDASTEPDELFWIQDPLNPDYAVNSEVHLRAFNSEFFLNSAAAGSQLEFFDTTEQESAYGFSYEWSIASTSNPAISLGLAIEPWNPATSDGTNTYRLACLGSTLQFGATDNNRSSTRSPDVLDSTVKLLPAESRAQYLSAILTTQGVKAGYVSQPAGAGLTQGVRKLSPDVDPTYSRFGRFSAVGRMTRKFTINETSVINFNQSAPLLDFFEISNARSKEAVLKLPRDLRCRGKIDVRLRVIDQCDPSQVAEFSTAVVTQCPPAPVAVAGCELATVWQSTQFPAIQFRPGIQTVFAGPVPDGDVALGQGYHSRWLPYNDAAINLFPNRVLPGDYLFVPPAPGIYEFSLLVSDGCWRDYLSNDTLTINAVCREISVADVAVPTRAGLSVQLSAQPANALTAVEKSGVEIGSIGSRSSIVDENLDGRNPRLHGRYLTVSQQQFAYTWRVDAAPATSFWAKLLDVEEIDETFVGGVDIPIPPPAVDGTWAPWFDVAGVYTIVAMISDGCSDVPTEATYTITVSCNTLVAAASAKYNYAFDGTSLESCQFDPLRKTFLAWWTGPVLPDNLGGGFTDGFHILLDALGSSVQGYPYVGDKSAVEAAGYAHLFSNWTLLSGPDDDVDEFGVFESPSDVVSRSVEPTVPGTYSYQFFLSDRCSSATSGVTITAQCNPLQINMSLDLKVPEGPDAGTYVFDVARDANVYYVPENGSFPDMQINARSVYTQQGPYRQFRPWDAALWLPYEFTVAENGSFGFPFPPEINCAAATPGDLTDPGFETGDPISCWNPTGDVEGDHLVKATGRWSARLFGAATSTSKIGQVWKVPAGASESRISFHWRHTSGAVRGTFKLLAYAVDADLEVDLGVPPVEVWSASAANLVSALGPCNGETQFCSGKWYFASIKVIDKPALYSDFVDKFHLFSFELVNSASSTVINIDTITLYLAGGTTPPPGVPNFFVEPYFFKSPGAKTLQVRVDDGCMVQTQTFAVKAVCRALTSQSYWTFPQKAIDATVLTAVTWDPVAEDGVPGIFGRWKTGGTTAGNDDTGVIGFKAATSAGYTDGSDGGYPPLSNFDAAKPHNKISVKVLPGTTGAPEAPGSPGIHRWQRLPPGGCNLMVSYGSPYNVSTASGVAGPSTFPTVKGDSSSALPSTTRKTVAFGFKSYNASSSKPPTFSDDYLQFGYYPYYLSGFIHACPLATSPYQTYITPTFAIVAVYPGQYVTVVSSADVMTVDCKKLGVLLGNDIYAPVTAPAVAIADNVINGTQTSGAFKMTYFALPPQNYGLFVQGTGSTDGQFELTTALYDPAPQNPGYIYKLINDVGDPSDEVNCRPFGGSDYLSWSVNLDDTETNSSGIVALNPNVASSVLYTMTISDGCTNSSSTVQVDASCSAWTGTPTVTIPDASTVNQFANGVRTYLPVVVTWTVAYSGGILATGPDTDPANALDAYLLVTSAPADISSYMNNGYYNALAMHWVSQGDRYIRFDALGGFPLPADAYKNSHNALTFYPPPGVSGSYKLAVLGQDGCQGTALTTSTVTVQCQTLRAAGIFSNTGVGLGLGAPNTATSSPLVASMNFLNGQSIDYPTGGYDYTFNKPAGYGILPSATLQMTLTASGLTLNTFTTSPLTWTAAVKYSLQALGPFGDVPGYSNVRQSGVGPDGVNDAWKFVNSAVESGVDTGIYYWEFVAAYTGTWQITLTVYDGDLNNYCSSASVTFTVTVGCDVTGYSATRGFGTNRAVNFGTSLEATQSKWYRVINALTGENVTGGVVYDYNAGVYGAWPTLIAIPPGGSGVVKNANNGQDIFASALAFKYAAAVITVPNANGFRPNDYWTLDSSYDETAYGNPAFNPAVTPVTASNKDITGIAGLSLAAAPPNEYFSFTLPHGVGGPDATSSINLYYAVFDGCTASTNPAAFTMYASCNRTIDNSNVQRSGAATVYWTGLGFQEIVFDVTAIRFFDEEDRLLPTRANASNTYWNRSSVPSNSQWTNLTGLGPTISSGGRYDAGHTVDVPGVFSVDFYTTDYCQTAKTTFAVSATCPAVTARATASRAPTTIDLISPTPQSTGPADVDRFVLALTSFDGVDVVLDASTSSVADYPGSENGHKLFYNWTVASQPSAPPGVVNYWEEDFFDGLRVSLLPSQVKSPVVVARLRVPGRYEFKVNVTDNCLFSVVSVYVLVTCAGPINDGGFIGVHNAVSYYDASRAYFTDDNPEDVLWRTLTLAANFTRRDGCEVGETRDNSLVRIAWTQASEPSVTKVYNEGDCDKRQCLFNPNDVNLNPWGSFQAYADPSITRAASTTSNVVGFTVRALDFCLSSMQRDVKVVGQCLPATLAVDADVVGSGLNAGEWDPLSHWSNLRVAFKVVYSTLSDSWEDPFETGMSPVEAAVRAGRFSVRWELIDAPTGSRLLNQTSGCLPNSYVVDESLKGISILQDCTANPGGVATVVPFLTFLDASFGAPVPQYSGFSNGRALAAKLEADIAGTYKVRAHWTDGCAYATLEFTVNAQCADLTARVETDAAAYIIPVGNASSWTCVTIDSSSTLYTQPDGTDADLAAINPRWFLTGAPANSQYYPYKDFDRVTSDVSSFPVSAVSGTSTFRISTDYAVVTSDSIRIWDVETAFSSFELELLGANGMSVCFLPDVEGSYTAKFLAQDFCPVSYNGGTVVATRNDSATTTFSVTCVGNFSYDVSRATRTVTANATNWTPIQLLPDANFDVPSASRYVRTFWNMTSAPTGHAWVPLDLSSTDLATLQAQYATLRVANLESVWYASFVPTVEGAYTFTLSVWDPRCPTSMTNRTITITVNCPAPKSFSIAAVPATSIAFKQDNVMTYKLSITGASQPVRYSWRSFSSVHGTSGFSTAFVSSNAAASSSSTSPTLTQGGIAGVVIGVIVGAILLLLLVVLIVRAASSKGGRGAVAADTGAAAGAADAGAASAV
jgi:hypothetical protein